MSAAAPVRVCVVGVGNFGRLHVETLATMPNAQLVAVCDPDARRRQSVMEVLGGVAEFDSFEACLEQADLDAVVLATPEPVHAQQAIAVMERGWDVLVEKPLALTPEEAQAVLATARRSERVAMVGTILRFSIPHRQLADAVKAGQLGQVLHIRSARYISRAWFAGSQVHPAFRATVHDIDQVVWLTGQRVDRVAAMGHTLAGERLPSSCASLLLLESGATASIETHFLLPPGFPSNTAPPERVGTRQGVMEVVGTAGIARLDDAAGLTLWSTHGSYSPDLFVVPRAGGIVAGALRAELEHFLACVISRTPSPIAPLVDSVHTVAVASALVRAIDSRSFVTVEEASV